MRILAVLFSVAATWSCGTPHPGAGGASAASAGVRLAKPAPIGPFEVVDLDGRPLSLVAWKGRVVVINVWATWCAPCRREMPALSALQARYPDEVRVLGLLQDNVTTPFARDFLRAAGVTYPVARSSFELESRLPAVLVLPTTLIVDRESRLVATFAGEAEPAALEREVVRLLGGSAPGAFD
jgi:thiol-disulfide isomerase/thioredoxin